jgi:hypothetical protein
MPQQSGMGLDSPDFQPVVRPLAEEVDPAATGVESTQSLVVEYTNAPPLTGPYGFRIYRVRVLSE